jgi:hypothetical protein
LKWSRTTLACWSLGNYRPSLSTHYWSESDPKKNQLLLETQPCSASFANQNPGFQANVRATLNHHKIPANPRSSPPLLHRRETPRSGPKSYSQKFFPKKPSRSEKSWLEISWFSTNFSVASTRTLRVET